ncbi:MAG TPA: hypothetical protein VFW06_03500 [Acidimicrobiia bacterium]|nr:hypothetical protein [Acidimicrobiia bacterium]
MADGPTDLATLVVEVEQLPDGRQLVVFADRREVVVGVARPRPHPVAGCEWISRPAPAPRARPRRAPTAGPRRGRVRVLPDDPESIVRRDRARDRARELAARRAEKLLRSLLDPLQQADWEANRGFWVATPRGPVRLGHLYALVHRPDDDPDREDLLCVVPHGHQRLPLADIWSNLLLVLAVDPDEFFRVAVHRGSRPRDEEPF